MHRDHRDLGSNLLWLFFHFKSSGLWTLSCDFVLHNYEILKWLSSLPILMQESFRWWQCSDRYNILPSFPISLPPSSPPFSPSLISLTVSVDVKHHVYLLTFLFTVYPYYVNPTSNNIKLHIVVIIILFWGRTFGGVYVPCTGGVYVPYSHAKWELP